MQKNARLLLLLPVLAALPLTTGCVALVAGAGAGYLISREVLPNDIHSAQVQLDADTVFDSTRETLEILADLGEEVTVQRDPRALSTQVDGALVEVEIEAYDLDHTFIRVHAEKYLGSEGETARMVLTRILDRLEE